MGLFNDLTDIFAPSVHEVVNTFKDVAQMVNVSDDERKDIKDKLLNSEVGQVIVKSIIEVINGNDVKSWLMRSDDNKYYVKVYTNGIAFFKYTLDYKSDDNDFITDDVFSFDENGIQDLPSRTYSMVLENIIEDAIKEKCTWAKTANFDLKHGIQVSVDEARKAAENAKRNAMKKSW